MGWQKKGTGHTYYSNSGHAYYIGGRSGKVIAMLVYYKKNTKCDLCISMGEVPIVEKYCPYNLTGSSKTMDASAALDLIMGLHENDTGIKYFVSDDDNM